MEPADRVEELQMEMVHSVGVTHTRDYQQHPQYLSVVPCQVLSALSIDWENMEDFDVNVDHSAHINANGNPNAPIQPANGGTRVSDDVAEGIMEGCGMLTGGACTCGPTCICVGCPIHDVEAQTIHQPPPLHTGRRQHRSSLRIKNPPIDPEVAQNMQVSFQV